MLIQTVRHDRMHGMRWEMMIGMIEMRWIQSTARRDDVGTLRYWSSATLCRLICFSHPISLLLLLLFDEIRPITLMQIGQIFCSSHRARVRWANPNLITSTGLRIFIVTNIFEKKKHHNRHFMHENRCDDETRTTFTLICEKRESEEKKWNNAKFNLSAALMMMNNILQKSIFKSINHSCAGCFFCVRRIGRGENWNLIAKKRSKCENVFSTLHDETPPAKTSDFIFAIARAHHPFMTFTPHSKWLKNYFCRSLHSITLLKHCNIYQNISLHLKLHHDGERKNISIKHSE